jgi:uncharacterized protein
MQLEHSSEVDAPLDRVWETLIEVERVAPCLPGAEITEAGEGGTYSGTFTVKLGPTTAAYAGKLELAEVDATAHRVLMRASGRDKRGQGSANATIESSMSAGGEVTRVELVTDFTLTGRLARFGRGGMIEDVSNRLVGDFVECLRSTIEPPVGEGEARAAAARPSQPVRGGRLFLSIIWARIKRLLARLLGR